jgi:hypothetical protein
VNAFHRLCGSYGLEIGVSVIRFIKQKLYPSVSKFISRTTLVEGRLKGGGSSFKCLVVGNSSFTEYLMARVYEEFFNEGASGSPH